MSEHITVEYHPRRGLPDETGKMGRTTHPIRIRRMEPLFGPPFVKVKSERHGDLDIMLTEDGSIRLLYWSWDVRKRGIKPMSLLLS